MSSLRGPGGRASDSYSRYPPAHHYDHDKRPYYDRRSRSRSRGRQYSPPARRRSPSHDIGRSPPRGPAADRFADKRYHRDWDRPRDERDDFHRDYSPSPRRGRGYYREHDRSYGSSRSRSRSPRADRSPKREAPPSKEIIMDGLRSDVTEENIRQELRHYYHVENLEDVRIIRDRQTRESKGFGFLRFSTIQSARSLVERNNGILCIRGVGQNQEEGSGAKIRIAYTKEKAAHREAVEGDWTCSMCNVVNFATRNRCFRCSGFKEDVSVVAGEVKIANHGDNDASPDSSPSQFLLLRGLEPSVTEEILAKGVAKLYKPSTGTAQQSQGAKKGAKVASTTGDNNLGAREGSLRRVFVVKDRWTDESWRFGFAEFASIEDAQAALIRYNSFEKFTIASKPVLVSYIHAGVFVPVFDFSAIEERFTFTPTQNPSMRLAYWDEGAYATTLVVNKAGTPPPSTIADVSETSKSKEPEKSKKRKADQPTSKEAAPKKLAPSHLQFWSSRHAELHGLDQKSIAVDEECPSALKQSYADTNRLCCYLCYRQFKTLPDVNRHERLSSLHRSNLKDQRLVARAVRKLEKHGVSTGGVPDPSLTNQTEYRDRARERRKAFGVQKRNQDSSTPSKPIIVEKPKDISYTTPSQSKGASLLSKLGYTGTGGLGASGSGISAPIAHDVYVAGVGLGAEGGKLGDAMEEAERNTKGSYSGFLERTKEGARERWDSMNKDG